MTPCIVYRGVDAEGYHRRVRSSCCRSGVVARFTNRRERLMAGGDFYVGVDEPDPRFTDYRCGTCNRALA